MINNNKGKRKSILSCFLEKPLTLFDWIIFLCIAVICFFSMQQGDIYHTGGTSLTYVYGHIFDFYEYNAQYFGGNAYMPSSYILFAIWNIPMRIFGLVSGPTLHVRWIVLMWFKALPTLIYLASGFLMYKIGTVIGLDNKKSKLMAYIFMTTPIAFFSQFIFGQYDIFTIFFVLLGIYFYFKNDTFKFVLFFGISITFKYFPVFIFIPMLLLKEKKYFKIFKSCALVAIPFALEILIYFRSVAFKNGVFGFGAKDYIFDASFKTAYFSIYLFVVIWVVICAWAYFVNAESKEEITKWFVFFSNAVVFLLFGLSMWHPQWLLFAIPFMVIGTVINKKIDVFLIVDIILMALFTIFTVNFWINHVDQQLFSNGIFKNIVSSRINTGLTMRQIYPSSDNSLIFSFFSGLLLVNAIFKHPKFSVTDFKESIDKHWTLIRTRFILGVSIFVVPAYICFFVALGSPYIMINSSFDMNGNVDAIVYGRTIEQYFIPTKESVEKIQIITGTYARVNNSNIKLTLEDAETGQVLMEKTFNTRKMIDNQYYTFQFPKTSVTIGRQYRFLFTTENTSSSSAITLYHNSDGTSDNSTYVVIDGVKQNYSLCIDIFGK